MTPADRFEADWLAAEAPPDLVDYLPDSVAVRTATLLELIRVDRRRRAAAALSKPLAHYRAEFPELRTIPNLEVVLDDDIPTALAEVSLPAPDPDSSMTVTATTLGATATAADHRGLDPLDDLDVGQRIDEFDLLTPLGTGAFARVFLARQRSMQRLVAVKVSENRGSEAQTLAQLDHEYIVRIFDQRVDGDRGLRILYMQYLAGGTLLDVLRGLRASTWTPGRTGRILLDAVDHTMGTRGEIRPADSSVRAEIAELTWPETVAWLGRRLADALGYAHANGVLHRDIKPANILLTAEGVPKLADFNISYSAQVARSAANPAAYFGGSLAYMSPEQLAAVHPGLPTTPADLDARSDIYSLGVVLWELLTGRKPFPTGTMDSLDDMLEQRRAGLGRETLSDLPPDTPPTLRRILRTCLDPDPDRRWRSGAELAQQFELCLDPHARNLVDPPPRSWRLRARRWRVPIIVLCTLVPNLVAVFYNIQQNELLVFRTLSDEARHGVMLYAAVANPAAFAIGAVVMVWLLRRVLWIRTGGAAASRRARFDALRIGDRVVVVAFALWMFSGMTFPFVIEHYDPTVPGRVYVHFLVAQAVCAAIAVAYPFFLLTFFGVRSIYPAFLPFGAFDRSDAEQLAGLQRRGNLMLIVAAAIPLVTVAGVTFLNASELEQVIGAIRIVCVGGILAFLLSYFVFRLAEGDIRALAARARAADDYTAVASDDGRQAE